MSKEISNIAAKKQISHQFNSISEIVNDTCFQSKLKENISKIEHERLIRPLPKAGMKYKRDIYDTLKNEGNLSFEYFIKKLKIYGSKYLT